jgi:uncharacterized small protein (TIGR04563 family)
VARLSTAGGNESIVGQKRSIYLPTSVLDEIRREAVRQNRSLSWVVDKAWKLARKGIGALPSANQLVKRAR